MTQKKLLLASLFVLLLVTLSGAAQAQEHSMTESELTRLEQIFKQLEENNNQLLMELNQSKVDLTQARQRVEQYQTNLATLQEKLLILKTESTQARIDLEEAQRLSQKAKQSFEEYEKEMNTKIKNLSAKRWSIGVGVGNNGPAGKIDFPIGENDRFGGWVYGDQKTGAAGVSIRF